MKIYICEFSGIDSTRDNVITNLVDFDDIYIDEECMVNQEVKDDCLQSSDGDGVYL